MRHRKEEKNPEACDTAFGNENTDQEINNATTAKHTRGSGGTREDRRPSILIT